MFHIKCENKIIYFKRSLLVLLLCSSQTDLLLYINASSLHCNYTLRSGPCVAQR